jgi:hypothetical protein
MTYDLTPQVETWQQEGIDLGLMIVDKLEDATSREDRVYILSEGIRFAAGLPKDLGGGQQKQLIIGFCAAIAASFEGYQDAVLQLLPETGGTQ